jgi:hypothetical protein
MTYVRRSAGGDRPILLHGRGSRRGSVDSDSNCSDDGSGGSSGEAMLVDPIKPTLQAPGTKRLNLEHDKLLSNFDSIFNLRHYTAGAVMVVVVVAVAAVVVVSEAGAYTRSLFSST